VVIGLQYPADDALCQERDIEVDQQADPFVGQLEVGQKLSLVNRQQFLHGFQFQSDFVLHEDIDLVTAVQLQAFVLDGKVDLPLEVQLPKSKLVAEAFLISRFQKTWAEEAMDFNGGTKNRTRPRIPILFLVFPGSYVNWSEALAHLIISSQNHLGHEEKPGV
jgi:hypothetical protein